jgi:hypothetical protein
VEREAADGCVDVLVRPEQTRLGVDTGADGVRARVRALRQGTLRLPLGRRQDRDDQRAPPNDEVVKSPIHQMPDRAASRTLSQRRAAKRSVCQGDAVGVPRGS